MKKVVLVVSILFLFLSCPTSPVEQKIKEKMDSAEISLKEGKYDYAKMIYYEVLKLDSSYTPAKFGVIIADIFDAVVKIQESVEVLVPLLQMIQQAQEPQAAYGLNYIIRNFLESILIERMRNHLLCDEQGDTYHICFDEIEKDKNFLFKADSIPIVVDIGFGPILSLDFGGTFNLGEVYFLEFIFSTVVGVAEILYTIDFNIDILPTFSFIFNSGIMDMLETNTLPAILKILGTILNANSNFLGFNGNTTDLLNSQAHLQNAFESLLQSIDDVKKRPFETDTIFTVGKEGNTIIFRFYNKLRKDVKTSCTTEEEKAGRNICIKMKVPTEIVGAIENISKSFHDPTFFMSWVNDIAPLIAIIFQTLIDSAIVLDFIDFITALLEIDEKTQKMIDTLKSFFSPGTFGADLIYGFLTGIIGDIIQISPAKLYEQAKNNNFSLRRILPVWTSYHDYRKGYPKTVAEADTIWLEWECGTSTVPPYDFNKPATDVLDSSLSYLVCSVPPVDSEHFTAPVSVPITIKSLPEDGIESSLPYFYLLDPTFASAVKINFSPLSEPLPTCGHTDMKTWHVPHDNCEVNGLIHKLLKDIIDLLKSGGFPS